MITKYNLEDFQNTKMEDFLIGIQQQNKTLHHTLTHTGSRQDKGCVDI